MNLLRRTAIALLLSSAPGLTLPAEAAEPAKKPIEPVDLVGKADGFYYNRNWRSYYWREDFSFQLKDEKSGQVWRIISREPTPNYEFRMGTTFPDLNVDWKANPRVRVIGVTGIDRQPADFYDFKLDEPLIATAFVVLVETGKDEWKEYYVNNWFHSWGEKANPAIHQFYADKKAPYDIYGYINGQTAPFNKAAKELIAKFPKAHTFHGLIHSTKDNTFGHEIELLNLVGPDEGGNGVVLFGDKNLMPKLDNKKPQ